MKILSCCLGVDGFDICPMVPVEQVCHPARSPPAAAIPSTVSSTCPPDEKGLHAPSFCRSLTFLFSLFLAPAPRTQAPAVESLFTYCHLVVLHLLKLFVLSFNRGFPVGFTGKLKRYKHVFRMGLLMCPGDMMLVCLFLK